MARIGPTLSYWLPETRFTVTAAKRQQVSTGNSGSHLVPEVEVELAHSVVADPDGPRALAMDAGCLEKIALTITLDENGIISAINSEAGRDLAPVLNLAGKVIGTVAGLASGVRMSGTGATGASKTAIEEPPATKDISLEQRWKAAQPGLAARLEALLPQVDRLLGALADPPASPEAIVMTSRALEAVQAHVASISEVRRAWILAQAHLLDRIVLPLRPSELLRLTEAELPLQLEDPVVPESQSGLAERFDSLVAMIDPLRTNKPTTRPERSEEVDRLWLRHSRPVTVGVYRKNDGIWILDSAHQLGVADRFGRDELLSLDGSWPRTKTFELAYHPDMSLKTYAVKTAPTAEATGAALGTVLDAIVAAQSKPTKQPSATETELAEAKARLDLLKTATEFEVLSATRERAVAAALAAQAKLLS